MTDGEVLSETAALALTNGDKLGDALVEVAWHDGCQKHLLGCINGL